MIIQVLIGFLPAAIANMAPVLVRKVPFLNIPIDGGNYFQGRRILGSNKTYRGLIFGILFAIFTALILQQFTPISANPILSGTLLGFGALGGDMVKSFFKRRAGVSPGKPWVVFDQIDWILGAILLSTFYTNYTILEGLALLIIYGILHVVANYVGYLLKLKKNLF